jgi:hypothetical protein
MDSGSLGRSVQVRQVERRKQGGKASGVEPWVRARPKLGPHYGEQDLSAKPQTGDSLAGTNNKVNALEGVYVCVCKRDITVKDIGQFL